MTGTDTPRTPPLMAEDAIAVAAGALSRLEGRAVAVRPVETISGTGSGTGSRNLVLRAVAESGGAARGVILKATAAADYDAAAADAFERFGLTREWAAASLLSRSPALQKGAVQQGAYRDGAAWLGGDAARGLTIFADLGAGLDTLVRPLLHGSAAEATAALCAHAAALGRMHAATRDCRAAHLAALRADFPTASVPPPARDWAGRVAAPVAALLDATLPEDEIALIAQHLAAPGDWLCLAHGDPCPDNTLLRGGDAILIDYEFAAPAHALFDALYARMAFPTCWCAGRVPEAVVARAEAAWRAAVAGAIPAAADDAAFGRESAIVTAAWLFTALALPWLGGAALREDEMWGLAGKRSRILHYLEATIRATDAADILPGIRTLAALWLARLRAAWPEAAPLAPYPAFAASPDA